MSGYLKSVLSGPRPKIGKGRVEMTYVAGRLTTRVKKETNLPGHTDREKNVFLSDETRPLAKMYGHTPIRGLCDALRASWHEGSLGVVVFTFESAS